MSSKLGRIFVILGTVLIISALVLFLYNGNENTEAEIASSEALSTLKADIAENGRATSENKGAEAEDEEIPLLPEEPSESYITIGAYDYIGFITIPDIDLELPVMADWDYVRLKIAPCRQFGTAFDDDLVIAGHNYTSHFGKLINLHIGDEVYFTDAEGKVYTYAVAEINTVSPYSVEEVKDSPWELVLYTCTYGGGSRVAVYCERVK